MSRDSASETEAYRQLHEAFDRILACYLLEHPRSLPSQITALDLLRWLARRSGYLNQNGGVEP